MEKMKVKKWKTKSLCTRKNVDSFHQLRSTNIKKRTRSIRRWRREQKKNAKKSGPKSSAWKEKWTEKVAYLQPHHISFEKKTFALLQKKKKISQRFHQQKHVWNTSIDTIYPENKEVVINTLHSLHFLKLQIIFKLFSVE